MQKIFIAMLLCLLTANQSFAIQGDCSWHGGIDCSAGADWDGSVVCNDGWRDSKDDYGDAEMCKTSMNLLSMVLKICDISKIPEDTFSSFFVKDESEYMPTIENARQKLNELSTTIQQTTGRVDYYTLLDFQRQYQESSKQLEEFEEKIKFRSSDDVAIYAFQYCQKNGLLKSQNNYTEEDQTAKTSSQPITSLTDATQSQFKDSIIALRNGGVINGYDDGTFKPFSPINRAEFIKIVVGAKFKGDSILDSCTDSSFSDIPDDAWYKNYACVAKGFGIVDGYVDGSFKPEQQINVAEALKITLKTFGIQTREANSGEAWYAPFVEYAQDNGYYLNTFNSDSKQLTREDMAELVYRIMENNQ